MLGANYEAMDNRIVESHMKFKMTELLTSFNAGETNKVGTA